MRSFAEEYQDMQFVQELLAQLTWYHNITLLEKIADSAENVLILESKEIAQRYLSNWFLRASSAREEKSAHK